MTCWPTPGNRRRTGADLRAAGAGPLGDGEFDGRVPAIERGEFPGGECAEDDRPNGGSVGPGKG